VELFTVTANRSLSGICRLPNGAAFITAPFVIIVGSDVITGAVSLTATPIAPNSVLTTGKNQPCRYDDSKQRNGENSYLLHGKVSLAVFPAVSGGPSIQMAFPPFREV
jgi:hypothetical protein